MLHHATARQFCYDNLLGGIDKKIGLQNLKQEDDIPDKRRQEDDPELQARRNGLQKFLA